MQVHILLRTEVAYRKGVRFCTRTGLRRKRVGISMPLEDALFPQVQKSAPSLSTHPKLGVRSKHHGFHSYAL